MVAFRNITKFYMHGRGLCNEARCDINQSNKATVKVVSFTERVARGQQQSKNGIQDFKISRFQGFPRFYIDFNISLGSH